MATRRVEDARSTVGVSRQVGERRLWAAERFLGIVPEARVSHDDHPL